MLGLIRPTAGRVQTLGGDPAGVAAGRARVALGYLPENVALSPSMTGAETVAFYARLKRQPVRRNAALLARVGLAEAAGRRIGAYSKGMRQRLGLAQAAGRFNHIFDPRDGRTSWRYGAVSVIASDATTADALSTAFCLLPRERIAETASALGVKVHVAHHDGLRDVIG